ncbi:MAG: SPASM domain-containing protein [Lachnospiraceae bacterium]|nr:SPASM domain-containing protein [Lachnospiraceae bacterium]
MRKFKKVYVEITNICNLNCSFCPKTKRKPMEMSLEFFDEVLSKIKPYTNYIYMHVMGEPLRHSNIEKLLDCCADKEIFANITTNGTLIKDVGEKIKDKPALRQINISLHSFEGEKEEYFQQYVENIFSFTRGIQKQGRVIICLRLWNLNAEGTDSKNKIIKEKLEKEFNLKEDIEDGVTDRNGIKLAHNIYLQQEERFVWPKNGNQEIFTRGKCFGLKTHIGILCDGSVVPCCIDSEGSMILGNIKENSLEEILSTKRAEGIKEGFRQSKVVEHFCRTCGFRHNV